MTSREQFEKEYSAAKKRRKNFVTASGDELAPLYTKGDAKEEFPGQFPYTRGVHAAMYRSQFWTMRQYAGFGTAADTNKRFRYLIEQGQTGLSVAFDLPTQIGYDSDSPQAEGEVGKVGVAIDTLDDMERLFQQIPLQSVSTSMTINASAAVLLALYIAVGEKQGVAANQLRGTIQNDILKEYIARGTYIFPPKPSMRIITDIFAYCEKEVPKWNTISVSGYHIREAGSTAAQEVGFTLADGIAYVEAAIKAGLSVDDFAPRMSFFFNAFTDVFEEVAKFRAARRLWATIMKERFGAKNPKSLLLRFHTQTAGSTLTAQQPDNNIVRVTLQALAAVLGGTQSLHTNSKDEAIALPTEDAVRIALRTQQLIAHESGAANVVDPLGGCYFIEAETDRIEKQAQEIIEKIDSLGGMVAAIEAGYVQGCIQTAAYRYQQDIERGSRTIVGVNDFISEEAAPKNILRVTKGQADEQIARLKQVKSQRSQEAVTQTLQKLETTAKTEANLIPVILDCVRNYASVGEVCNVLRSVFGEYREHVVL